MEEWDEKIERKIQHNGNIYKYGLRGDLEDTMAKFSPTRRTKAIMEFKNKYQNKFPLQNLTWGQIGNELDKLNNAKKARK